MCRFQDVQELFGAICYDGTFWHQLASNQDERGATTGVPRLLTFL